MLKAIIFDMDDTLFSEKLYVLSGFRAVARWAEEYLEIPYIQGYTQLRELFQNGVHENTFNAWLEAHDLAPDPIIPKLIRVYREHEPEIAPFPEVPDVLSALTRQVRLGIISDGYIDVQQKKWRALKLNMAFIAVVFSDQWGRQYWKPHHRPFEEMLRLGNLDGLEAMYVGDDPDKDFLGAKELGMYTARIRRPEGLYYDHEPPSKAYAPLVEIESLEQLLTICTQLA